ADPIDRRRSFMLGGQARYLNDRLVLAGGYRRDFLDLESVTALRDPVSNEWTVDHPDAEIVRQKFDGTTKTLGVVGHVTKHISLFYNASDTLQLPNTAHRILPDGLPPPLPESQGQD